MANNEPAVNLGAGGFVSYFEDGGATVDLEALRRSRMDMGVVPEGEGPILPGRMDMGAAPEYDERGVGSFLADQFMSMVSDRESFPADEIRASGRSNSENRDVYYPGGPTFFETLAEDYGYPVERLGDGSMGISPLGGKKRMEVPRSDLPKAQELEDARGHMLASAMAASRYGPETAMSIGDLNEQKDVALLFFGDPEHEAMDKRNNAVGISLFKQAGIDATDAELTKMVDKRVFGQLDVILGRTPEQQAAPSEKPKWRKNFRSPKEGPDVYFPREDSGYFKKDHRY